MRLLAIGAHPDDVDILCAGTLAKYAAAGHHVTIAIATNGNVGSTTLSRSEIAEVRRREAVASCAVIGAELIWMDFEDEWLFNDRPSRTAFIDAYRQARPDIVIAHSEHDYHPDHRISGQLAADARIPAAVPLVETRLPALDAIPKLYTMDTIGQLESGLDVVVDITDQMPTKTAMLTAHVSQAAWLEHIFDMSYIEFMTAQAAQRGAEIGVAHAEAFREVPSFPAARPDLPALGQIPLTIQPSERNQQ